MCMAVQLFLCGIFLEVLVAQTFRLCMIAVPIDLDSLGLIWVTLTQFQGQSNTEDIKLKVSLTG